jgi:GDPmannose 4,6-dehydratase
VGTGQHHSVKDFLQAAFNCVGIENWEKYVVVDPTLSKTSKVPNLKAKADKARLKLAGSLKEF